MEWAAHGGGTGRGTQFRDLVDMAVVKHRLDSMTSRGFPTLLILWFCDSLSCPHRRLSVSCVTPASVSRSDLTPPRASPPAFPSGETPARGCSACGRAQETTALTQHASTAAGAHLSLGWARQLSAGPGQARPCARAEGERRRRGREGERGRGGASRGDGAARRGWRRRHFELAEGRRRWLLSRVPRPPRENPRGRSGYGRE